MRSVTRKYENDLTFVGNQLEEFLNRARKKSLKEKSIMLLFQTLSFTNDKTVKELSDDEINLADTDLGVDNLLNDEDIIDDED